MKFNNIPITSWDLYEPENPEKNIGHTIKIPNRCMDEMLYSHKNDGPIFIEIISMKDVPNARCHCLVFANVEITEDEIVVVPYWSMTKLGVEPFELVSIENVNNVRKAGFIKVRANHSDYIYWDGLKETLETEFSKINAISVGDLINIFGIEFYVIELKDQEGIGMLDASLFNTDVKIDFDTPSDIVEEERRQKAELERIEISKKVLKEAQELANKKREEEEELRRNPYFRGKGETVNGNSENVPIPEISREDRAKMFEKLFQKKNE